MKPLLYQVLLIGALWVEWNHFQFQQIKHHRWTWTGIIFSSMLGILDEKEKMILYVLKCWEQDVMVFEFSKNIIRFWLLQGLCRKAWDFIDTLKTSLKTFENYLWWHLKVIWIRWKGKKHDNSCACWKCIGWFWNDKKGFEVF